MLRRFIALTLAALLCWAPPMAFAAWHSVLQVSVTGGAASPVTALAAGGQFFGSPTNTVTSSTFSQGVPTSGLVMVLVFDGNSGVTCGTCTVTDPKGNSYTRLSGPIAVQGGGSPSSYIYIFYSYITTPMTTSDTVTYTGPVTTATTFTISAHYIVGYASGPDAAVTNSTSNNFATSYTVSGAGTAAVANELNIGFSFSLGTMGAVPSGFNISGLTLPSFTAVNEVAGWQINSGTSPLTYAGTNTSQWVAAIIVAFKP